MDEKFWVFFRLTLAVEEIHYYKYTTWEQQVAVLLHLNALLLA